MPTRGGFQQQINDLQDELIVLGSMAQKATLRAMDAFHARDLNAARGIAHDDNAIDEKRYSIEEEAMRILAMQQPMAGDLRLIAAVLQLASEIERIGDHAEGIARIVVMLGDEGPIREVPELEAMAERAVSMLDRSLKAFVERDTTTARAVCDEDDEVDALQDRVYHRLLKEMFDQPAIITKATYLIWVSHNLERIADRSTNICERVVFLTTGRMEEMNVSVY
ncbi:MAG: phosphate signaling complex protein PhoU [Dehalococcoidia bacterium]|nr:phosphate signaling complex protein PhoU [Dehalococcoidia bacterium]